MSVLQDVRDHADSLKDRYKDLSNFEALQIATKVADIEAYKQAHVLDREGTPSALEAIAICLGMGGQFSVTITDALNDVASQLGNVASTLEEKGE